MIRDMLPHGLLLRAFTADDEGQGLCRPSRRPLRHARPPVRPWPGTLRYPEFGADYGSEGTSMGRRQRSHVGWTAGAVVLVYTGFALSLRRFAAWLRRRRTKAVEPAVSGD